MDLSWVDISKKALVANLNTFRHLIPNEVVLAVAVKGNAYGHGLVQCSKVFLDAGVQVLCVNAIFEARELRKANITSPLLVIGYTPLSDLREAVELRCDLVVYNLKTIQALGKLNKKVNLHLKIETGNHRQGICVADLPAVIDELKKHPKLNIEGISTHFANIEDGVSHKYALYQLKEFNLSIKKLELAGLAPRYRHAANTAASIVLPEAHFNFVRLGIGAYGMWPSIKTQQAADHAGIEMELSPSLTWKTIVAQIKNVKRGALIGYGCTYEMARDGQIAILPVGYYDGYARALSNKGYVVIRGKKAPVIGRVCMNMTMVDITDVPGVELEDEVTLIGDGVTAEDVAKLSDTINYEVTTRINDRIKKNLI